MRKIHITRLATATGLAGALAVASIAMAADKKPAAQPTATAATTVKFEHVRVERAPAAYRFKSTDATAANGMRAFVDPASGTLRSPTAEDTLALASADAGAKAKVAGASSAKRSAVAAPAAAQVLLSARGGSRIKVDESLLSYSVARVAADGSIEQDCVVGTKAADAAMNSASSTGAHRHDK